MNGVSQPQRERLEDERSDGERPTGERPDDVQPGRPVADINDQSSGRRGNWRRWLILTVLIAAVLISGRVWREQFRLDELAARELQLRAMIETRPAAAWSSGLAVYAVATMFLPVASVLSLLYGWLFGFWRSLVIVSFASTSGATGSFLLSRYLLGDWIQRRYATQLASFNEALERDGVWFVLTLRLIPYVPFYVINPVLGLTKLRVRTFWWASQLGMLPGTCVYLWAASNISSVEEFRRSGVSGLLTPQLAAAIGLLAFMPWILRWTVRRFGPQRST